MFDFSSQSFLNNQSKTASLIRFPNIFEDAAKYFRELQTNCFLS